MSPKDLPWYVTLPVFMIVLLPASHYVEDFGYFLGGIIAKFL